MTVVFANNERAKRRNYHAVCEHDGLTWQRSHQEVCLHYTIPDLFCLLSSVYLISLAFPQFPRSNILHLPSHLSVFLRLNEYAAQFMSFIYIIVKVVFTLINMYLIIYLFITQEKKNKTKAELLAEERDYKRRRMSYRGKKLKRTPLQVHKFSWPSFLPKVFQSQIFAYAFVFCL